MLPCHVRSSHPYKILNNRSRFRYHATSLPNAFSCKITNLSTLPGHHQFCGLVHCPLQLLPPLISNAADVRLARSCAAPATVLPPLGRFLFLDGCHAARLGPGSGPALLPLPSMHITKGLFRLKRFRNHVNVELGYI